MLNRTAFGRHIYAIGDDPDAARLAGINTDRTLLAVYVHRRPDLRRRRLGPDRPHRRGELRCRATPPTWIRITAVVIGGTSLFGGRGSIVGTLIGALIVGVFRNGLALAGVDVVWQEFTVGLLIIVAVDDRPVDPKGVGVTPEIALHF